jgi:RecA-family ATPase
LLPNTVEKINEWYYDKAYIFDNSSVTDDEYEGLLKVMVDAICRYDVKLVCIDNLMTAMECDANTDLYRQQSTFVKNLEKLAQQYDVAIVLVAHPKKTNADFDNDTVSGSSDITNAVSFVLNYQRASESDNCDSKLMITKNRMNGKLLTGENSINLYYSEKSKRILSNEVENIDYGCFRTQEDFSDLDEIPF